MATFSIGTHLSMFQHSRYSRLSSHTIQSSPPQSHSFFASSSSTSCRTRFGVPNPKLLRGNVLVRAEDKARDSNSQTSQQQFQVLLSSSSCFKNTLLILLLLYLLNFDFLCYFACLGLTGISLI